MCDYIACYLLQRTACARGRTIDCGLVRMAKLASGDGRSATVYAIVEIVLTKLSVKVHV